MEVFDLFYLQVIMRRLNKDNNALRGTHYAGKHDAYSVLDVFANLNLFLILSTLGTLCF